MSPTASYTLAQALASSGQFKEAVEAYSRAIDGNPAHIAARCGRALSLQRLADDVGAVADFDEVIRSGGDWQGVFLAYYGRAVSRSALGQHKEAIVDCNEALERGAERGSTLYVRAIAHKELGELDEALSDLESVIRADPKYEEAFFVRGQLHSMRKRYDEAASAFTGFLARSGNDVGYRREAYYWRGVARQELGNHIAAVRDFSRAIELGIKEARVYHRRWRSYRELGEVGLANADLEFVARLGQPDR